MNSNIQHQQITDFVLRSFYQVFNGLGFGFLQKVYQNSMFLELSKEIQLINCLKETALEVGLVLNFGKKAQFKRKYLTTDRKQRHNP